MNAPPDHPPRVPPDGAFDPTWLALREPADHAARSAELVEQVRAGLDRPSSDRSSSDRSGSDRPGPVVVRDLGSGTGSMARWLAPRLPGPQHWVLYDHDPQLLARSAVAELRDSDGAAVQVQTRTADLAELTGADLAGSALVTASALLDLLTAAEVNGLVAACAAARCPALLTLSVTGQVELDPPDPVDAEIAAAFDAHQRRGGRLGPEAPEVTAWAFRRHGMTVRVADSPWRLDVRQAALVARWLDGRAAAAVAQRPELADPAAEWLRRRHATLDAGELRATVGHRDLLAVAEEDQL